MSDQKGPLELVEESGISFKGVECLDNESGIQGENMVVVRLMQVTFKPPGEPFNPSF